MSQDLRNIQRQQNRMERTTTRLRKTFQYPTDDDSEDDLPEVLDEEGDFPFRLLSETLQPLGST
jgi:hypothetical protein